MCVYIYLCMCVYIYTYIYTHIYTYIYTHTYIYIYNINFQCCKVFENGCTNMYIYMYVYIYLFCPNVSFVNYCLQQNPFKRHLPWSLAFSVYSALRHGRVPVSPSSGLTYANVTVTHLGIWLKENFLVIVMLLNALLVTITQSIPLSTPVNFMVSPLACKAFTWFWSNSGHEA